MRYFVRGGPGSDEEKQPWMFHLMKVHDKEAVEISFETDRLAFIGRGHTVANPVVMSDAGLLKRQPGFCAGSDCCYPKKNNPGSGRNGNDRYDYRYGRNAGDMRKLVNKYQDKHHKDRVFELAWTHSQVVLRQINAIESDAQLYSSLANSILFMNPTLAREGGQVFDQK